MATLANHDLLIDYTDDGEGPPVILIHSSVSANRQWRALIEELKGSYRVLAVNLRGYGETTPWSPMVPQTLAAQAELVLALCMAPLPRPDLVNPVIKGFLGAT